MAKILSWLLPAILGAAVSMVGLVQGYRLATSARDVENRRAVAVLKLQIVEAANHLDFRSARLLLDHVLKPIDDPSSFDAFAAELTAIINERAPETAAGSSRESLSDVTPAADITTLGNLADRLYSDQRLAVSNGLIQLYRTRPTEVVAALLGALRPANDPRKYRVNLYVAFTLARIAGGWKGTTEQLAAIEQLRSTRDYGNATFKQRVDEAVGNYGGLN